MPFGTEQAWGVILPVERRNLIQNPSLERGTTGYTTIGVVDFGTFANPQELGADFAAAQVFGAWGGDFIADQPDYSGVAGGTWTSSTGSAYNASLYVRLPVGSTGRLMVGTVGSAITGASIIGSAILTGGGTFHRYAVPYTEASTQVRRMLLVGTNVATQHVLFDGAQVEMGSITTYLDGDQEGCYWTGLPHNSTSIRSGTSRAGGTVIALSDLGLIVSESPGAGMPPLDTTSQSFALLDGAQFQRQRGDVRTLALNSYVVGTSRPNLHAQRQTIIDALKIDLVSPQQPTRFWYVGGPGTVQIDAVLDDGLGFNQSIAQDGFSELPAVRFLAHDPFWYSTTDQGASLPPRTAIGSVHHIAWRDPQGRWGTMGVAGTTVQANFAGAAIYTVLPLAGGTVLVGGLFGTVGGTVYAAAGRWDQATNRWGTLVGGSINLTNPQSTWIYDLIQIPSGSVFLGGNFGTVGGTQGAWYIARWNGSNFGTLIGGTLNNLVRALLFTGTLYAGGLFSVAGGTAAPSIVRHVNNAWGTLTGGTLSGQVFGLARGLDGRIFAGGNFPTAGGTANSNGIAYWDGAWGTMGSVGGPGAYVDAVAVAPSGILYLGGQFGSINGGAGNNLASYNGVQLTPAGAGIPGGVNANVYTLLADQQTGDLIVGGQFSNAGGIDIADGIAVYTGYAYHGLDIAISPPGTFYDVERSQDGTLYAGGTFSGTAQCASVTQVFNTGRRETYPVWTARNAGAGTARIYQLLNTFTGDEIYFNYTLQPGEDVTLDFTPGAQSFTSSFAGNIYGNILAGGDLATWRLMPGTNYISFFADSDSLISALYWRPRHWSFDAGTNL